MSDPLLQEITQASQPVVTPTPQVQTIPSDADLLAGMTAQRQPEPNLSGGSDASAPTLDDAIEGNSANPVNPSASNRQVKVNPGKALTDEQILGIFGTLLSRGFDPETRKQFLEDYKNDELTRLGLEFSDLQGALADLGFTVGSPTLSPWTKLAIGGAALVGGGLMLRTNDANAQTNPQHTVLTYARSNPEEFTALLNELGFSRSGGGFERSDLEPEKQPEGQYVDFAI